MPPWLENLSTGFLLLVMLIGLFGLIVPIFPGGVVIWLAALVYGLINGFSSSGTVIFILITLLMLASAAADNIFITAKAHQAGASWWSILVAIFAGLLVTLIATPIGGLVAAPLAMYLMEYRRHRDTDTAWRITRSMLAGWGLAFVVRFGLGSLKIGLWLLWAWGNLRG
jgi:hypothetical protein